jgi:hypothetical protein
LTLSSSKEAMWINGWKVHRLCSYGAWHFFKWGVCNEAGWLIGRKYKALQLVDLHFIEWGFCIEAGWLIGSQYKALQLGGLHSIEWGFCIEAG